MSPLPPLSLGFGRPFVTVVALSIGAVWGSYSHARTVFLFRRDGVRTVSVSEILARRVPVGSYVKVRGVRLRTGEFAYEARGSRGTRTEEEYSLLLDSSDPAAQKVVAFRRAVMDLRAALQAEAAGKATKAFATAGEAADVKPDRFVLIHRSKRLEPWQTAFADERAEARSAETSRDARKHEDPKIRELRKFIDRAAVLADRTEENFEVTGTVESVYGDVATDIRNAYGVNDPLALNPANYPDDLMLGIFGAGVLGLLGTGGYALREYRAERGKSA
jgi:transcription elongation GreA/GreB family factor